jgi:ubiquinone/menaquinone biosynthesis C-methylase UbiE
MADMKSNKEWIYWGRHDPLFAVSSARGKEIGEAEKWTPESFLETGRRYFADVYRQWMQYGVGTEHCAEIGCGSARITKQLAAHFDRVTAIDVSPGQLETARTLLGADGDRVTLVLVSDAALPLEKESCDGVFSCEVFQHFDDDRGLEAYIGEAHRVLRPGGTLCFQVPLAGVQPTAFLSSALRNRLLALLRRFGRRRMMIYRRYRPERVFAMLAQTGFQDPELRVFHADQQDGFHCYFFGRKP